MKLKLLTGLSLSAVLFAGACGGSSTTNTNANANKVNMNVATPTPVANMSSGTDSTVQAAIEKGLKDKGCTGATVSVAAGVATVKGTVPKGKLPECVMAVNDAKPGKVENQMVEAK